MQERISGLVPMEQVQSPKLRFVVPLPEYLAGGIGVRVDRLQRLMRLGGVGHLRVTGETDQDISQSVPTVVGFTSQGGALAGKAGVTKIPTFTASGAEDYGSLDNSLFRDHAATFINCSVNLNLEEISARIRQENRWTRGVYSKDAWAYHFDQAIKKGVSDTGIKHLVLGLTALNWGDTAFQYALMGAFSAWSTGFHFPSPELAFRVPLVSLFLNAFGYVGNTLIGREYRLSLIYGPQLDRALVLGVLGKTSRVVQAIPNKK